MKLNYERTWCDYLTPCPHRKDVCVGEYECSICNHHKNWTEEKVPNWEIGDYARYFYLHKGYVECDHPNNK